MKIEINKEDYEFLKDLQHELNTQTNDGNADPVYWGVMEKCEVLTRDFDGEARIPYDDGAYSVEELVKDIEDALQDYDEDTCNVWKEVDKEDAQEVADFAVCDLGWTSIYNEDIYYVKDEKRVSTFSGAFLTKRECQNHINANKYHYDEPHTYAMTAYRNFELERLLNILKTIDLKDDE